MINWKRKKWISYLTFKQIDSLTTYKAWQQNSYMRMPELNLIWQFFSLWLGLDMGLGFPRF